MRQVGQTFPRICKAPVLAEVVGAKFHLEISIGQIRVARQVGTSLQEINFLATYPISATCMIDISFRTVQAGYISAIS